MTGGKAFIEFPAPHPGQRAVLQGADRFTVLCAGRRWFKTTLAEMVAVEQALMGAQVIWAGPTYDQVQIAFDGMLRMGRQVGIGNRSRMEVRVRGGSLIRFRSMDNPEHARGHTADGVIVDEAASVDQKAWYEVLRPVLMTTHGWAWLLGTPRGDNWFRREYERGLRREGDTVAFLAPTLGVRIEEGTLVREPHALENPHIEFSEVMDVFQQMPERTFRQEILAEFVADAGGVFRLVREASTAPAASPGGDVQAVFGIDWGRSDDFTVISILDTASLTQLACVAFSGVGWDIQRGRIRALYDAWRPVTILAEANSIGEPNIEALRSEGLAVRAFQTTSQSKEALIGQLSLAIERGRLKLLNDPLQIAELEGYQMGRLPGGGWRYGAPPGGHDDRVIALALAYEGALSSGVSVAFASPMGEKKRRRLVFDALFGDGGGGG